MRSSSSPAAEIIVGTIITILLNIGIMFGIIFFASMSHLSSFFNLILSSLLYYIGLVQMTYILPICITLGRNRQWNWMKGIIIGACITALLNGGCWLLMIPKR
jgi:hypothetical protein